MKVCFISHSARLGGAELVLLETVEILKESGAECYAVLPGRGPLLLELQKLHVPVCVTSYALWMSAARYSWMKRARALLNIAVKTATIAWLAWRWKCELLYSNTATVCVGALAAALLGRPHVWHLHELGESGGLHFLFGEQRSYGAIEKLSSLVIVPSQAVADQLSSRLCKVPIRTAYCSMHRTGSLNHPCTSRRSGPHAYRCVMAGALTANKGQKDAVLALRELRRKEMDAELLIAGEGDPEYRERLRRLVQQCGLEDRVSFLGQIDDPMSQIGAADVVLVCSRAEGFGRVAVEAMLAGKPVIGAANSATAELIRDGSNGLLYRTADSHDLAKKIEYLHGHPEVAARLGENGQRWAQRMFTRERYQDEIVPLLASVLASPAQSVEA